ncbi:cytochrome c-type biogenesis protein [Enterovirga sp.]|uniref:cytochrome c-type biogenesis protein n=1 Tax=Enterovirga sp. TaxID=2026350 RepID=UPI002C4831B2|nr:cytochrome c-type biogenesis protein [Enterovirga sp.]HMO30883.1 cytochrome c-type biogenesis protein CcmH [Enterovirga sp.]
MSGLRLVPAASVAMLWLVLAGAALAVQPGEMLADKGLEARARRISTELRCLVCQNQSIDDSDAPLAHDLRLLVRDRLRAGDSDAQVRDFVVSRYGDFVLLRPPVNAGTFLLWFGPAFILAGAALGLLLTFRRRTSSPPPALTPEEEARLAALVAGGGPGEAESRPGPR